MKDSKLIGSRAIVDRTATFKFHAVDPNAIQVTYFIYYIIIITLGAKAM